ncbi:MAG TPA: thiamine pyrophosphate-binding protein [Candidatus Lustribacter sp.]|jgi:thiamine pyrophosphate-dependent acetolactate synthase large subunit-like protein|nr:thiamine pyrophosphate-binding protein [Candidatus Lustribacter sp.]
MTEMGWGSDAIAQLLRDLKLDYAALVPGSSYRGLHDSFVNYLDAHDPKMLVCLHEEHTVAIAHGYAKVTGKPMLAVIHANVGLMHATMAFYGAWCDRVPIVVLGANGPHDASKRRPWIDWIHTSRDPAALVRPYTKWDDEPGSVEACLDSITRAHKIATTPPFGPTYVVLDVAMQEQKLAKTLPMPNLERFAPPAPSLPAPADVKRAVEIMRKAKHPVILVGRQTRDVGAYNDRVALAEALGARVISDFRAGSVFPTTHPLHVGKSSTRVTEAGLAVLNEADAILSLESFDLGGLLNQVFGKSPKATIIQQSVDFYVHNGWSMDHQAVVPSDLHFAVVSENLVSAMLDELGRPARKAVAANGAAKTKASANGTASGEMGMESFCDALAEAFAGRDVCYSRLPLGLNDGSPFAFHHPLDFLGGDGGGGVGAGPGIAVGAALALKGTGRMPVAVLGDGDYLMGLTALWTAVANEIPLLVIVANNNCYNNDVAHQDRVARERSRPVERKWIGQMITDPAPDLAMLARGQGAIGIGRIDGRENIGAAIAEGIKHVEAGKVCVIDVYVSPDLDQRRQAAAKVAGTR